MSRQIDPELMWAAGFYDGEGSSYVVSKRPRDIGRKVWSKRVAISIGQNHSEVLERFCRAIGIGHVIGPYNNKGHPGNGIYFVHLTNKSDVKTAMDLLYPHIGSIKRQQFDLACTQVAEFMALPVQARLSNAT